MDAGPCPRCGRYGWICYAVMRRQGGRVAAITGRKDRRGVTCQACAAGRVSELDQRDRQGCAPKTLMEVFADAGLLDQTDTAAQQSLTPLSWRRAATMVPLGTIRLTRITNGRGRSMVNQALRAMSRPVTEIDRIADAMRGRIVAGEFGEDGKLPTEVELCDRFGVSRPTIREMYRRLILEGLVVSIERKGYFVHMMRPISLHLDEYEQPGPDAAAFVDGVDQWEREVARQGRVPLVRVEVRMLGGGDPAPAGVEQRLGVEPGAPVLIRDRVCYVDKVPWMLRPSYFPGWLADEYPLLRQPGDIAAPGGLLVAIGRPASTWRDEQRARMPTVGEADRLQLPAVTPGIEWTRTRVAADGTVLAVMQSFLPGDRVLLAGRVTVAAG